MRGVLANALHNLQQLLSSSYSTVTYGAQGGTQHTAAAMADGQSSLHAMLPQPAAPGAAPHLLPCSRSEVGREAAIKGPPNTPHPRNVARQAQRHVFRPRLVHSVVC